MSVRSSPVLPLGWVTTDLPLRSAYVFTLASASATTWKYCGYRLASWHTLVTFFGYGGRAAVPSPLGVELARPMGGLPSSTPRPFAMPAAGGWGRLRAGTDLSPNPLRA